MFNALSNYKATMSYIIGIVFINSLFTYLPDVTLFNQPFSPADIGVGVIYILRDFCQREIKSYVLFAMLVGGILSYVFAANEVAFASICAFFIGEFIDWSLFTFTKKPLSQRLLLSSLCSCPLDTVVFLGLISRLNYLEFTIMTLFKFLGIFAIWYSWRFKQPKVTFLAT